MPDPSPSSFLSLVFISLRSSSSFLEIVLGQNIREITRRHIVWNIDNLLKIGLRHMPDPKPYKQGWQDTNFKFASLFFMLYCANFPRSFLRLKVPFALFNRFWILLFISPSLFITLPKEVKDFVGLISWSSVVIGDGLDTYTESHDFSFLQADVELRGFVLHLTMRMREQGYVISTKSISLSVLKRDNLILFVSLCCLSHDPVDGQIERRDELTHACLTPVLI